jgi:hypothetical protein
MAEDIRSADAIVEIVNKKAYYFMTSVDAVLVFEAIKYMRSEILLSKNSSNE